MTKSDPDSSIKLLSGITPFGTFAEELFETMTLPLPSSPVWADIISGKKAIAFESLTIKIFLGSAQQRFKLKPETMSQIVAELHNLFEKNIKIPTVQRDIEKLA